MKSKKTFSSKDAFTLVEIIIAALVLVMLLSGLYDLFMHFRRVNERGMWVAQTTNKMRIGLDFLRQELNKVSIPSIVSQRGTEPFGDDRPKKLYHAGNPFSLTNCSNNTPLLRFFMCLPGSKDIIGEPAKDPLIMEGYLEVKNKKLVYRRSFVSGDPSLIGEVSQVICEDPFKIDLRILPVTDQTLLAVNMRNFVELKIEAQSPKYPETRVIEKIEAPFEVEFQQGGHL
ncbi:MAG: hypothetical protein HQM10_05710 [Candidatus Riflebacteria bacterium]|nr:hypothetical protein [Candidatus Riflebacteria bacterium]